MIKLLGKSWKTTLLGLVIILGLLLSYFGIVEIKDGGLDDVQNIIGILMAIGFFATKDGTASHSDNLDKQFNRKLLELEAKMESKLVGKRPDDRG
jgi:uncharacterized membrane protein